MPVSRLRSRLTDFACCLCLTIFFSATSPAQVTTGTITGTVSDANGQSVAGAQVTITDVSKNTTAQFATNDAGEYTAPFLVPSTYEVAIEKTGFKRLVRSGVVLQVDQTARIDATMEVGEISETTTVIGGAPLVNTEDAGIGEVIEERPIRELPLNGRNFATLVYLVPGVTPGQAGENLSGASTFNPRGASNFNALGHHANSNAWLIDGIDNNEYTFNTVIVTPSIESVREFKVLTGTFSAEFGRGAGVVSVSTKSGSNDFHGTLFEFLRNDVFDARNYFAPRQTVPKKPPFRRNQYGFALSGPLTLPRFGEGGPRIWSGKNKTFIFGDYAGLREIRGLTFVNTVPTAKTRVGDFSEYINPRTGQLVPIYNPYTTRPDPNNPGRFIRDPFPGNIIPSQLLNQVGLNVASIYPLPNGPGNFDNYTSTANRVVTDDAISLRGDHKFGEHDSLFVRYNYGSFKLDAPQGQAACCLPTPAEAASRFDLG
ncbi:MAG TPA: carboxypeptidase regulatory-like domain-containing protein, partial [Pyrinomonadaceae bacterium]|nr:carboxypeptidase regulatory-like domain-containing protein [Pyrinomonadaceae bacterium]